MSRGVYVRGVSVQEGICPGVTVRGVHVRGGYVLELHVHKTRIKGKAGGGLNSMQGKPSTFKSCQKSPAKAALT